MRIFVVGGAGYIGSVCAELLLDEGHDVAIFDNLTEGHGRAVDSRANFIQGALADREQIQGALSNARPEAVMHFAANALVGESMRDPSKYFRNNVCSGLNLLDAMIATGVQPGAWRAWQRILQPWYGRRLQRSRSNRGLR